MAANVDAFPPSPRREARGLSTAAAMELPPRLDRDMDDPASNPAAPIPPDALGVYGTAVPLGGDSSMTTQTW